ncbi:MAG: hypothetical protein GY861_25615 [bacterium]|nr:hypothetical protein [bacterium]
MKDQKNDKNIFYEGNMRTLSEAGALFMKKLIEEDLPNSDQSLSSVDPYKHVAEKLGKSYRRILYWSHDWDTEGGAKPTITDFLNILNLVKSKRVYEFINALVTDVPPEKQAEIHKEILLTISEEMEKFSKRVKDLAQKKYG